jgi:hypothetical protein
MVEDTYVSTATIPRTGSDPVNGGAVPVAQAGRAVPEDPGLCQTDAEAPLLDPVGPGEAFICPEGPTEGCALLSQGEIRMGADDGIDVPRYTY